MSTARRSSMPAPGQASWPSRRSHRARTVFAVEPVATLRAYMRAKAARLGIGNLYVLDGTLDAIPLPPGTADLLVTCRAIGWNLQAELTEIERILRPDGSPPCTSSASPGLGRRTIRCTSP